ncbi:uncharacterized protein LOC144438332 [Glandiceps talaboti]
MFKRDVTLVLLCLLYLFNDFWSVSGTDDVSTEEDDVEAIMPPFGPAPPLDDLPAWGTETGGNDAPAPVNQNESTETITSAFDIGSLGITPSDVSNATSKSAGSDILQVEDSTDKLSTGTASSITAWFGFYIVLSGQLVLLGTVL